MCFARNGKTKHLLGKYSFNHMLSSSKPITYSKTSFSFVSYYCIALFTKNTIPCLLSSQLLGEILICIHICFSIYTNSHYRLRSHIYVLRKSMHTLPFQITKIFFIFFFLYPLHLTFSTNHLQIYFFFFW